MKTKPLIEWQDFDKIDIRTGTVVDVTDFEKASKPAYKLYIDFGELGIRKTSAQITERYDKLDLVGSQVMAVVNFPPKQIADFMSECLVLGVYTKTGVVLITTTEKTADGLALG
ncbi:MAG TPA: tRNA-binding protein [Cryomorphaceae bacterium]|nr:tRNA-binding protein [Cryomorphaceae bacterium]